MRALAHEWQFDAIGTRWTIHTDVELDTPARSNVAAVIYTFDRTWSRFRDDSAVWQLAVGAVVPMPADARDMFRLYDELGEATAGAVNPLVGSSLESLGYDRSLSLAHGSPLAAPAQWRELLRAEGDGLVLTEPALIDVGAIGKGRLVDLVLAVLADVPGAVIVDASGDAAVRDTTVRVALEHPFDATKAIGVVTVDSGAICGSAVNRRVWGSGLHHVLDARTGIPVETVAATWALGADAMTADGVATALFFDGGSAYADAHDVAWVRMFTDGRVQYSADRRVELFTTNGNPA